MQNDKTLKIIGAVRNMTDHEADILEAFISGFRAGKQVSGQERAETGKQSYRQNESDEYPTRKPVLYT